MPAVDQAIRDLLARRDRMWEDACKQAAPHLDPPLVPDMLSKWYTELVRETDAELAEYMGEADLKDMRIDELLGQIDDLKAQVAELGGVDDADE